MISRATTLVPSHPDVLVQAWAGTLQWAMSKMVCTSLVLRCKLLSGTSRGKQPFPRCHFFQRITGGRDSRVEQSSKRLVSENWQRWAQGADRDMPPFSGQGPLQWVMADYKWLTLVILAFAIRHEIEIMLVQLLATQHSQFKLNGRINVYTLCQKGIYIRIQRQRSAMLSTLPSNLCVQPGPR